MSAVSDINDKMLGATSQRDLFTFIARVCASTFDYPYVSIVLFDSELTRLEVAGISEQSINMLATRRGPEVLYKSLFPLEVLRDLEWAKAVRNGNVYVTTKPHELFVPFAAPIRAHKVVRRLEIAQGIMLPLVVKGKPVGALKACSRTIAFEENERAELLALAHHVALAAELWRVRDHAEGRTAVLKRLHTLSQTITGTLDLDVLYQEITRAAGRLAPIDFCTVNTLTSDRKSYENHAAWGEGKRAEVLPGSRSINIFSQDVIDRALAGEAILIPDLGLFPVVKERLSHRMAGATAIFPFSSEGKMVGFMTVGRDAPGEWEAETVEILQELVEYVTVAYTNARRFAEATRQAAVQKALAESARMIARAETDSILQTIVQEGSTILSGSQFAVLLPDNDDNLEVVAASGPFTSSVLGYKLKKDSGLLGRVFTLGQPMVVSDIQAESDSTSRQVEQRSAFRSWMAVPLLSDQGHIGVLAASHPQPGLYGEDDLTLLSTLADHATIALEKQRLLQEAKRQAAEQTALAESANAVARLDVQAVLHTIATQASKIVKQSRCSVFLFDPGTYTLRWAAGQAAVAEVRAELFPADAGLMGQVFTTATPVLVDDITVDSRTSARHLLGVTRTRSFLCVPLRWGEEMMGVLLTTHPDVGVFSKHDLELISTFADYASIALSNARLYSSLQQREGERTYLLHQLMTGQEAERRRVAVDIHDGPLQSIGVNMLAVDRIRKLLDMGRGPQAMQELIQVREDMALVVQELRDVINALRPVVLENLGLVTATEAQLNHLRQQTSMKAHLEDNLDGYRLPSSLEVVFFRLLQEALTNVRKHSNAESVWVTFAHINGEFCMNVTDNGIGFDPRTVVRAPESGHIGLHSMQERIEAIGGRMEIDSTQGHGTRITFCVQV